MSDNLDELYNVIKLGEQLSNRPLPSNLNTQTQIPEFVKEANRNQQRALDSITTTAKNTGNIYALLETESEERKIADDENLEYTKRMDAKNHRLSFWALIIAIAGLIVALAQLFESPILSFLKSIFG